MYLETNRMTIRDFVPEDAADLYDILGDRETMENCEPAYSPEKTKSFLHSFCIDRKGAVAAVHKERGKVIGYILLHEFDRGVYEIGWFFNRRYWRQGYAYEACKAVMDYAFCHMNAYKIFAETVDMVRSAGLIKKLGMQFEDVQQAKDAHGNWVDLYCYRLFYQDWRENRI